MAIDSKFDKSSFDLPIPGPSQKSEEINEEINEEMVAQRKLLDQHVGENSLIIFNIDQKIVLLKESMDPSLLQPIDFATIDEVPIFPGCENADDKRTCFNHKIMQHISKNFRYPQEAQDKGIQGKVYVHFMIDETGGITEIEAEGPDTLLEEEVVRIIKKLPKMIPGKQQGKPVIVPFSIAITFKLQ